MSAHVADGTRGDFRETPGSPTVRKVPEFSQFSGKSLVASWHILQGFLMIPSSALREGYIPNMSVRRVIVCKEYIFMANPGGSTAMSAHVVDGALYDFRETREARKAPKVPEFSQFPEKSLGAFLALFRAAVNDFTHYALTGKHISNKSVWWVIDWKWYISLANPGGRTSMYAHVAGARGIFGKRGKWRKRGKFRHFRNFRINY